MAATPRHLVQQMLSAAAEACDERKADDIRILALDPAESGLTDYFLICSGNSDRQNIAITDAVELKLKQQFGTYPTSVEGRRVGEWIIMDYVDFIVHVFSAEKRAYYGLDRLRKSATSLTVADLNAEIKAAIANTRKPKPTAAKPAATKSSTPANKKSPGKKTLPAKPAAKKSAAKKSPAARKPLSAQTAAKSAAKKSAAPKTMKPAPAKPRKPTSKKPTTKR